MSEPGGMRAPIARRRVLRIAAAMAGLSLGIAALRATAAKPQAIRWQGDVMGAESVLTLWHGDPAFARAAILKARLEIARLENIFSLYRKDSEIGRLNAAGRIKRPSPELVTLIDASQKLSALSGGAFDISVQPLWRLYEAHFWSHAEVQSDIAARASDIARAWVDYRNIDSGASGIGFTKPGMGITLNAMAQGFITDRIADLLRNEGFETAMVDLGETRTLGRQTDGSPFRVAIPAGAIVDGEARSIPLIDEALAVSGGYGTTFEPTGRFNHIFDPATGASANRLAQAAVTGASATVADGLATAICVTGEAAAQHLLDAHPGTRALLTRLDGSWIAVTARDNAAV